MATIQPTHMNHNNQSKIALINDLTGFGRCSVSVQMPVISQMGVQCCVLPTAVLSNHTQYSSYHMLDLTDQMRAHINEWRKLKLSFKGICTGFLGSEEQIAIVSDFIDEFGSQDCHILVDPVMGDYGRAYATYTPTMCKRMVELVGKASLITPNLTEAYLLAGKPYCENPSQQQLESMAQELCELGPKRVVITGIERGTQMANVCMEQGGVPHLVTTPFVGGQRTGAGDVFSAVLSVDGVKGVPLEESVLKASNFIGECVTRAVEMDIPSCDGLPIEEKLCDLR